MHQVYRVAGTDQPQPAAFAPIPNLTAQFWVNVGEVNPDGSAKSLMAAAGYANGFKGLDYLVRDVASFKLMSQAVQAMLKQALEERRITYAGDREAVREYIHVADAARLSVDILAPGYANRHLTLTGHERLRIADVMHARLVDSMIGSFVFEITGASDQLDAFINLMEPLGLTEVSRAGVVAIARGAKGM